MKDFDHLLSVWQEQPKQVKLSVEDVLKQVKKGVNKLKSRLLFGLSAVTVSLIAIVVMMLFMPVHNTLTYVGMSIWIICFITVIAIQTGDYRTISTLDATIDPATYLSHLKLYKKRRAVMNGRFFYYYTVAVSIGVMFYTYEITSKNSLTFKISFLAAWLAYLAFVIFYLKKKLVNRENQRVAELITRLENLKQQFE